MLDGLVAVHNSSLGRPEPCERNLVAVVSGGLMVKHPWPLLEISLSYFSQASHVKYDYLPTYLLVGFGYWRSAVTPIINCEAGLKHPKKDRQDLVTFKRENF